MSERYRDPFCEEGRHTYCYGMFAKTICECECHDRRGDADKVRPQD